MSDPFLAEIRMVGFNFPPRGWAFLDGQIMPINQNQPLYSLLGITYGGDGRTTFALPDLRGRTPVHKASGPGFELGNRGGTESLALTKAEIPAHRHVAQASSTAGNSPVALDHIMAAETGNDLAYRDSEASNLTSLNTGTVGTAGGGQAHDNMQPYISVSFCIALFGVFPSQN